MPRHRRERVPLYRTRRRAAHAARRVPLSAAIHSPMPEVGPELSLTAAPLTAPELTGPELTVPELTVPRVTEPATAAALAGAPAVEKDAEATATAPLPAFRRRLLQISSPAGPTALGGANPLARATRRLMVTPMFAVAAGFVIAAGVWIYSPHATLEFPVGKGGEQPCQPPECKGTQQAIAGAPAGAALKPVTSGSSAGKLRTQPERKITYRLLGQSQGKFFMLITVSSTRVAHPWHLTFDMLGVDITGVEGARWQPAGSSRGTASWPVAGTLWQNAGTGGGGYRNGNAGWFEPGESFVVVGTGVPVTPEYCSFDQKSCKFIPAATTDGLGGPSGIQNR